MNGLSNIGWLFQQSTNWCSLVGILDNIIWYHTKDVPYGNLICAARDRRITQYKRGTDVYSNIDCKPIVKLSPYGAYGVRLLPSPMQSCRNTSNRVLFQPSLKSPLYFMYDYMTYWFGIKVSLLGETLVFNFLGQITWPNAILFHIVLVTLNTVTLQSM